MTTRADFLKTVVMATLLGFIDVKTLLPEVPALSGELYQVIKLAGDTFEVMGVALEEAKRQIVTFGAVTEDILHGSRRGELTLGGPAADFVELGDLITIDLGHSS